LVNSEVLRDRHLRVAAKRCKQAEKPATQKHIWFLPTRKPTLKKPKELFFANARMNKE